MRGRRILVVCILVVLLGGSGAGLLPVQTADHWDRGTFTNTTVADDTLMLENTADAGAYRSQVFDTGDNYSWATVAVESSLGDGDATLTVAVSDDGFDSVQARETFDVPNGTAVFNISDLPDARYARFNYTLDRGENYIPQVAATNITFDEDLYFQVTQRECLDGERTLFSMSGAENAHAAGPGVFDAYRVCAGGVDRSNYEQICARVETDVLSFFGNDTVTHLSTDSDQFDHKLCTGTLSVGVRDTCPDTTRQIVSIYDLPQSHVSRPGVYDHQLCGAVFTNVSVMLEFHLAGNETVQINGTRNPTPGEYDVADASEPGMVTAENDSLVAGIVAGERTRTTGIGYTELTPGQRLTLTQDRQRANRYFIPFTEGSGRDVDDRRSLIAQNQFLDQLNPNFALEFVEETVVRVTAPLQGIDLVTDRTLATGIHQLVITNLGTNDDGEPQVAVNVTTQ